MSNHNHRESSIEHRVSSIKNLTLAHFRHFSSLFTNSPPLHLSRILYKSPLFMQNKPNSPNVQMNVSNVKTMNYENFIPLAEQKNKPNSNPNKPNLPNCEIDAKCVFTKDYIKKAAFAVRKNKPNSNPISVKPKMSANLYVIEDYENETTLRPRKNKPKQTQFKPCPERSRMGQFPIGQRRNYPGPSRVLVIFTRWPTFLKWDIASSRLGKSFCVKKRTVCPKRIWSPSFNVDSLSIFLLLINTPFLLFISSAEYFPVSLLKWSCTCFRETPSSRI